MEDKSRAYYNRLLRQYIEGTISQEDRFVLEKHALEDPFLFEALEGLQDSKIGNDKVIDKLKMKVEQSVIERKSRVFPLLRYAVAASLILMLGVGLWMFNINTTPTDSVVMNTTAASETRSVNPNFEIQEEEPARVGLIKQESKTKVVASKNQYDTPKAVISQVDNEENFEKRNADYTPTKEQSNNDLVALQQDRAENVSSVYADTEAGIAQAPPSPTVNDEISEGESLVIETEKLKTEEVIAESIVLNDNASDETPTSKRRSTFNASKASIQHIELDKSEYISSLDKNIIVAPPNGITAFRSILSNDNDTSKLVDNNNLEVVIEFRLTQQGKPTDLKIITDRMGDCGKKVIESIKNSGNWITFPPNSKAIVRLKMPCF